MTFQPNMTSRIEGVTKLGDVRWRAWNGVIADVWTVECARRSGGEYLASYPRLFFMLDGTDAGHILFGTGASGEEPYVLDADRPMSYIPAGVPLWTRVSQIRRLKHLDLHLDMEALQARFGDEIDPLSIEKPRLAVRDERLVGLARLIAAECESRDRASDLYGDSLIAALCAVLFNVGQPRAQRHSRLPSWQLRRVIDFIDENCLRTIRLQELADLSGLSQSYFCQAFKASTGMRPHEWQMKTRMNRVKSLLREQGVSLTSVAATAGFSDQAHFTRVFRRMVGTTPAAWRRERLPGKTPQ